MLKNGLRGREAGGGGCLPAGKRSAFSGLGATIEQLLGDSKGASMRGRSGATLSAGPSKAKRAVALSNPPPGPTAVTARSPNALDSAELLVPGDPGFVGDGFTFADEFMFAGRIVLSHASR